MTKKNVWYRLGLRCGNSVYGAYLKRILEGVRNHRLEALYFAAPEGQILRRMAEALDSFRGVPLYDVHIAGRSFVQSDAARAAERMVEYLEGLDIGHYRRVGIIHTVGQEMRQSSLESLLTVFGHFLEIHGFYYGLLMSPGRYSGRHSLLELASRNHLQEVEEAVRPFFFRPSGDVEDYASGPDGIVPVFARTDDSSSPMKSCYEERLAPFQEGAIEAIRLSFTDPRALSPGTLKELATFLTESASK